MWQGNFRDMLTNREATVGEFEQRNIVSAIKDSVARVTTGPTDPPRAAGA